MEILVDGSGTKPAKEAAMKNEFVHTTGMVANSEPRGQMTKPSSRTKTMARLAVLGLFAAVLQLTGCASAGLDESKYNPVTGYPAVGDRSWNNS